MSDVTSNSFDVGALFSGDHRPTHEVKVLFNESIGMAVYQVERAVKQAELDGDDKVLSKLRKEYGKLLNEVKTSVATITLRGLIEDERENIRDEIFSKHPDETDILGRPKPNPAGDREFLIALWKAYIVKITLPNGTSMNPSAEEIETMYKRSGPLARESINQGISELNDGVKAGFELAFKELDFL